MKKLRGFAVALFTVFSLLPTERAVASHAMGGELSYVWLHDSTYRVFFRFYRDCAGTTAPQSFVLCYHNTCTTPVTGDTAHLQLVPDNPPIFTNGTDLAVLCPGVQSNCLDPNSAVPGFLLYTYSCEIVLNGACSNWVLSTTITARNSSDNLYTGTSGFPHYEATLNNLDVSNNSSPQLSTQPVIGACAFSMQHYSPGAVDPDGDSLYFELIEPRNTSASTCGISNTISNAGFATGYTATNPIGGTFSFSSVTGQTDFQANMPGKYSMAYRVSDYRNGIKVGSVTRDFQQIVVMCTSSPINFTVGTGGVTGGSLSNGVVTAYAGQPLAFCYTGQSASATAQLRATDAHGLTIPAAGTSYTGQFTDTVQGCLSWTPALTDTGWRFLPVQIVDSNCPGNGALQVQSYTIPIHVLAAPPGPGIGIGVSPAPAAIRVFPNPVSGYLQVTAPVPVSLQLSSTDGRLLRHAPNSTSLDMSGLPAGVYFLRVADARDGAVLKQEKVIKE